MTKKSKAVFLNSILMNHKATKNAFYRKSDTFEDIAIEHSEFITVVALVLEKTRDFFIRFFFQSTERESLQTQSGAAFQSGEQRKSVSQSLHERRVVQNQPSCCLIFKFCVLTRARSATERRYAEKQSLRGADLMFGRFRVLISVSAAFPISDRDGEVVFNYRGTIDTAHFLGQIFRTFSQVLNLNSTDQSKSFLNLSL